MRLTPDAVLAGFENWPQAAATIDRHGDGWAPVKHAQGVRCFIGIRSTDGLDLSHKVRHLDHNCSQAEWRALTNMIIDENYTNFGISKKIVQLLRHGLPRYVIKMDEYGYVNFDDLCWLVQRF